MIQPRKRQENTMSEKYPKTYKVREVGGTKVLTVPDNAKGEYLRKASQDGKTITFTQVK